MAVSKIEFTAKDVRELTKWLKRFSIIDNSVLIEIDEASSTLIAKSYNEERSIVKMASVKFDVAGLLYKKGKDQKRIKVGIYSISRLIKILNHFNNNEFSLTINYDILEGDNTSDFVALNIICKNNNLRMLVECTPLSIFKYISDDLFKTSIAATDSDDWLTFTQSDISDVLSLCDLDSDNKFLDWDVKKGKFSVSGKSFNKLISDEANKNIESTITLYKEQFEKLDIENYDIVISDDRIVCKSIDSDTITVLSAVQKDELDEKKEDIEF